MNTSSKKPDLIAESLSTNDPAEHFRPVHGYACQTLPDAFVDIEESLKKLFKKHKNVKKFDATAFYSKRRPELDAEGEESLAVFNQAAFTAAESMGGLVVYYQGHTLKSDYPMSPDIDIDFKPDCLSFCIWENRSQAVAGASVVPHKKAVARTHVWYENFALKKYQIDATDMNAIVFREFKRN